MEPYSRKYSSFTNNLRRLGELAAEIGTARLRLVTTHYYGYYGLE
jgi:hypothetical protein